MPRRNSNARYRSPNSIDALAKNMKVPGPPSVWKRHSFELVRTGGFIKKTTPQTEPVYYRKLKGFRPDFIKALADIGINGISQEDPFIEVGFRGKPPQSKKIHHIRCKTPEIVTSSDGQLVITTKINREHISSIGNVPDGPNQRLNAPDMKRYNGANRFNVALGFPEAGADLSGLIQTSRGIGSLILDTTVRTDRIPAKS